MIFFFISVLKKITLDGCAKQWITLVTCIYVKSGIDTMQGGCSPSGRRGLGKELTAVVRVTEEGERK